MAWNERTVEELRAEFVKKVLANEKSKSALCKEYGISRPTGDKWIQHYLNNELLSDKGRGLWHSITISRDGIPDCPVLQP